MRDGRRASQPRASRYGHTTRFFTMVINTAGSPPSGPPACLIAAAASADRTDRLAPTGWHRPISTDPLALTRWQNGAAYAAVSDCRWLLMVC